jgi:GTP-binding protein HflX
VCYLSALTGEGVSSLMKQVEKLITPQKFSDTLLIPFEFGRKKAWLHEHGVVVKEFYTETGFKLDVMWSAQQKAKYHSFSH